MADNTTVTAGAGTIIGTDERTINGTAVHVQRVDEQGSNALAISQVTPTTTAATLVAARDTRKQVVFVNRSNVNVWIGPATVTTTNGFILEAGYSDVWTYQGLLQVIIASGTATGVVYCRDEYDS